MAMDSDPLLPFATQKAFATWMAKAHTRATGVWIKFAKKESGIPTVTYAEALEVALCYGWIDGIAKSIDATYYQQRFTPRAARSKWSKINCGKALALIEAGKMKDAGRREVERAKADGRWAAAYDGPRAAAVPADLELALRKNKPARAFFATLDSRNRYAILHRIQIVKKSETRERRIATFVQMLAEGKKLYP